MRIKTLDPKAPAEVIPVGIDFSRLVSTIDSVDISVSVKKGVDANPAAILLANVQITLAEVRQLIQGGVDGVVYLIRMDVYAGNEVYSEAVYLPIKELI